MSERENFLSRWSRRKHAAEVARPDPDSPVAKEEIAAEPREPDAARDAASGAATPKPDAAQPSFDLASLPPIESITAATDIRVFLLPGVPAALSRAALRRAWSADPAIRNYVGLSENAWDFTDPDAMTGFGPLEMTDELRQMVEDIVGGKAPPPSAPPPPSLVEPVQAAAEENFSAETAAGTPEDDTGRIDPSSPDEIAAVRAAALTAEQPENIAAQKDRALESAERPAPRGHGGALPR